MPEEDVSRRFDRLLNVVQDISAKRMERLTGGTYEVLVEDINTQLEGFVTGRLENNAIVHFKGDTSLIGQYLNVHLDECKGFYFLGTAE